MYIITDIYEEKDTKLSITWDPEGIRTNGGHHVKAELTGYKEIEANSEPIIR